MVRRSNSHSVHDDCTTNELNPSCYTNPVGYYERIELVYQLFMNSVDFPLQSNIAKKFVNFERQRYNITI